MIMRRRDVLSRPTAAKPAAVPTNNASPSIVLREHLLNRFGYGGSPSQRAEYDTLGPTEWLTKQIDDCAVPNDVPLWLKSPADYQLEGDNSLEAGRKGMLKEVVQRAISDEPSLAAVLRDHWFNHFNVFAYMGISKHQLDTYLNDAIMPFIVGNFGEMILETMKHPAMLQYLNNRKNYKEPATLTVTKPDNSVVHPSVGPNQNYAREVLELHTVGAENHSQADVEAATRILSGASSNFFGQDADRYEWRGDGHDIGEKELLGQIFPANGDETELVLFADFLAGRQETSNRIGRKLAQRFIGPMANATTINGIALIHHLSVDAAHIENDLDLAMRQVANVPQMVDPAIFGSKFKPPHRFIVSAYRSLGISPSLETLDYLVDELILLGDMPFFYGPPTGFPDDDGYWLTGDGMLARAQIAREISVDPEVEAVFEELRVVDEPVSITRAIISAFLPAGVSDQTQKVVDDAVARSEPEPRAQIARAVEVVLSSPEFLEY